MQKEINSSKPNRATALRKPKLFLSHGASGNAASMQPWVDELAKHGIDAVVLNLPRSNTDKAVAVFANAYDQSPKAMFGGHSFGGRMASLLAAKEPITGLILLSYPLHRPGHPDQLRTQHWKNISCPVLVLSGDRDPFAQIKILHREIKKFSSAEVVIYEGMGHGLLAVVDDACLRIAQFLSLIKQ